MSIWRWALLTFFGYKRVGGKEPKIWGGYKALWRVGSEAGNKVYEIVANWLVEQVVVVEWVDERLKTFRRWHPATAQNVADQSQKGGVLQIATKGCGHWKTAYRWWL